MALNFPDAPTIGQVYQGYTWDGVSWNAVPSMAVGVAFTPAGGVAATNVQAAIVELDTEKASLAVANTWAAVQGYNHAALTYVAGGTTAWNVAAAPMATLNLLGGNSTMGAPTGYTEGRVYTIRIQQESGAVRSLAWNAAYRFAGGAANVPVISTASGAVDRFTFMALGSGLFEEVGRAQGIA